MDSTNIVSNIDTTGIASGPHSTLEGVTPVFDIDRESQGYEDERDVDDEVRWSEKAVAAGSEEYQNAEKEAEESQDTDGRLPAGSPDPDAEVGSELPYSPQVTSPDTSGTDEPVSGGGHEEIKGNVTDTLDTSNTGGEPNDSPDAGGVEAASDLSGPESATALASDPSSDAESPNDVTGEPVTPVQQAWDGFKVLELSKIAKENGVDYPSGSNKAEIISALVKAGVTPPATKD